MSSGLRLNAHARSSQHATVQTTARSCTAEEAGKQHSTAESAYVGREIIPYGFTGRAVGVAIRLLIKPGHKLIHSHTHTPHPCGRAACDSDSPLSYIDIVPCGFIPHKK